MRTEKDIPVSAESDLDPTTFFEVFPEATLDVIQESEVPAAIMDRFERKSKRFTRIENYRPRDFDNYFLIRHNNGDITYGTRQTKTYDTNHEKEQLTYMIELRGGQEIGHAEIRKPLTGKYRNPFVGYTETEQPFRAQGLGTRRLKLMNAFSETHYLTPLMSDPTILEPAESLWQHLIDQGIATTVKEGKRMRYSFIPRAAQPA